MENNAQAEESFSEMITNPVGVPGDNKDSEKIRVEHRRWKKELESKRCNKVSKLSYWQRVSITTSL